MILIFGGAYQGKQDYALETYGLSAKDVYQCDLESMVINFDKKVIANLERFILVLKRRSAQRSVWKIISRSCGIKSLSAMIFPRVLCR